MGNETLPSTWIGRTMCVLWLLCCPKGSGNENLCVRRAEASHDAAVFMSVQSGHDVLRNISRTSRDSASSRLVSCCVCREEVTLFVRLDGEHPSSGHIIFRLDFL